MGIGKIGITFKDKAEMEMLSDMIADKLANKIAIVLETRDKIRDASQNK